MALFKFQLGQRHTTWCSRSLADVLSSAAL